MTKDAFSFDTVQIVLTKIYNHSFTGKANSIGFCKGIFVEATLACNLSHLCAHLSYTRKALEYAAIQTI